MSALMVVSREDGLRLSVVMSRWEETGMREERRRGGAGESGVCRELEDGGGLTCGILLGRGAVATHCLLEAVVALVTRTRDVKAILLEDRGDEGARVCN